MTGRRQAARAAAAAALAAGLAAPAAAQTDYYNTDAGRPVRVEDAYPVERYAFELQLAPVRLERSDDGVYAWEVEPEVAYGILPGTHLEVGFPLAMVDAGTGARTEGLAGIHVSALHNLNVETSGLPAFAVGAAVRLPVGKLAPDETRASVKGIATRTWSFMRVHLNGEYTVGSDAADEGEDAEWMAGIAVDRVVPLRALLWTADVFVEQPLERNSDLRWTAEAGFRYQVSPQWNVDGGVGRVLAGGDEGWFATFGTAYAFAVRSLMPGR